MDIHPVRSPSLLTNKDIDAYIKRLEKETSNGVKKYGVIVRAPDGRDGLLLPDIEGIDNVKQQISIARQKAGIAPSEEISLYRFTVDRHQEN